VPVAASLRVPPKAQKNIACVGELRLRDGSPLGSPETEGVVMSVAIGYTLPVFRRFLGSLRRSGFSGPVIVGVDAARVSSAVQQYACSVGAQLEYVNGTASASHFFRHFSFRHVLYRRWAEQYDDKVWILSLGAYAFPIVLYLCCAVLACPDDKTHRCELFLFLDFRDSVFQRNPLAFVHNDARAPTRPTTPLVAFEETRVAPVPAAGVVGPVLEIASCPYNGAWIKFCFGQHVLQAIGHHPISCAGALLATASALQWYAREMLALMQRYSRSPYCKVRCVVSCHDGVVSACLLSLPACCVVEELVGLSYSTRTRVVLCAPLFLSFSLCSLAGTSRFTTTCSTTPRPSFRRLQSWRRAHPEAWWTT